MLEYRVTKYDPGKRDAEGRYIVDDWISRSQIGEEFGGRRLSEEDYQRVEDAYVEAALRMLRESGVERLAVHGLENARGYRPATFDLAEGAILASGAIGEAVRGLLREHFWCRLASADGAYVHVGRDFYLYLGVPRPVPESISLAQASGLFVEPFASPYAADPDDEQPNERLHRSPRTGA
jgi:hypothetical protein